jgi:hypothetical protein
MFGHADMPPGARFLAGDDAETSAAKEEISQLHLRRIDISDGIYIINVGGYIGESTKREIEYARAHNKAVEWMFDEFSESSMPLLEVIKTELRQRGYEEVEANPGGGGLWQHADWASADSIIDAIKDAFEEGR